MFKHIKTNLSKCSIIVLLIGILVSFNYSNLAVHAYVDPHTAKTVANLTADCVTEAGEVLNEGNCGIYKHLTRFVNAASALVGVVVVIMIVVRGIQYSAARDNPQATASARNGIWQALLALMLYLFMFSFLQWLVPGGIL